MLSPRGLTRSVGSAGHSKTIRSLAELISIITELV